ncbi:MAG: hypothetical protein GXW85_03450 [Clostridia bacterium]|nr:hypothetical protein [Clostridia bacterium]
MFILKTLLIIIVFVALFLLAFYYIQRYDLLLKLKKTRKNGNNLLARIKSYPDDTKSILALELNLINECLNEISAKISSPPSNKELELIIPNFISRLESLERQILDKKEKWEKYLEFKGQYDATLILLRKTIDKLRTKGNMVADGHKDHAQCINEKVEQNVNNLKSLIKEYDTLIQFTFNEFNFYLLEQIEKETAQLLDKADLTLTELRNFADEFRIFIKSINKKSPFYITLEAETDNSRSREWVGEISVSYKTFRDSDEGKKYKKDIYISGKRVASASQISFVVIQNDQTLGTYIKELNNQEFEDLYDQLPIDKQVYKEVDEKCYPYEISLFDLDVMAWEKPKYSFEINAPVNLFKDLTLKDVIELNKA